MISRSIFVAAVSASMFGIPANTFALTEAEVKELCKDGCVLMTQQQYDAVVKLIQEAKDCRRL